MPFPKWLKFFCTTRWPCQFYPSVGYCCAIIVTNMRAKWKKKRMRRLKRKRRQAKK
ncbi:hypothetical protein T05_2599 [Trichinella murrelli]|uniref:60S ribosomal protein L41 n=1 Tax=Trichinella murrelli TaxID=144512 RepID=A0A0V0U4T0_9BILA|nr:hypothetical protein T05_2599 [Trichinella murrelli]